MRIANARGSLPFKAESFDILFLHLAPLGERGKPNVQAGYELLKPGGWYFEAGLEKQQYEIPLPEWAIQHGFESADHHIWLYRRMQSEEWHLAWQMV